MIAAVHLTDLGPREAVRALRLRPRPKSVPGLRMADLHAAVRLGGSLLKKPMPGRVALVSAWDDDAALDAWLERTPAGRRLAQGWSVRLQPLRAYGAWSKLPPLVEREQPVDDGEPVAVLTYGRPRLPVLPRFLAASHAAEERAKADPAMVAGVALAAPPLIVATFSVWRSAAEMRAYATRTREHVAAMKGMREHDFHHESLFARFRPYAESGTWDGREPVAAAAAA